ncbi:hypothetical protein ACG04R_23550 [Roseateles sp. BYS78W]|uniref:Uncharacterized protein n=1 Tax=Pelomonas candidula TaxID=3299025 RepID=A0ABW7HIK5_9BURK
MEKNVLTVALLVACAATQAATPEQEVAEGKKIAAGLSQAGRDLCVFDNGAPADVPHQIVRKLKVAKGTYGGVKELLPKLVEEALASKADAIADYNSSQRFGFWPWRVVRPVVTATAIRWDEPPRKTCEAMGGVRLEVILTTNRSPEALANSRGPSSETPTPAEAGEPAASSPQ